MSIRRRKRPFALRHRLLVAVVVAFALPAYAGERASAATRQQPVGPPILVIERVGGFVPVEAAFARLPVAYVGADSRLFTLGPQVAIYPPPALAAIEQRRLLPAALKRLRALAAAAALDQPPPDYGRPPLSDAMTTRIMYRDKAGRTFVHSAYALGIDGGVGATGRAARRRLTSFIEQIARPQSTFGRQNMRPSKVFVPSAFEVRARKAPQSGPTPMQPTRRWPVASVRLAQAGSCTPVTGPDAAALRAALRKANQLTRWKQGGRLYLVANRPVLPGEGVCR